MLRTRSPLRSLHQILHPTPFLTPPIPKAPSLFHSPLSTPSFSSSSRRDKNTEASDDEGGERDDLGAFALRRGPDGPPKLFVVQPRLRPESLLQAKLSEALNLANSLEDQRDAVAGVERVKKELPPHRVVQNPLARSKGRADKYFGPGTVDDVKCHIQALDSEDGPDAIFVNTVLSGIQQRNLECAWGKPVLDRVGIIIEIFNAHAQTKEAKLQSELAALMYKSTRLVRVRGPDGRLTFGVSGESEVVSARGKGSGGRGFLSGAGESEIQLQRRRIQERRERLLHEIEEVRRTRALQRYARRRRGGIHGQGLPTVAVVGYTNAGKSTLVSALSQSHLYSDDRLFATVDPLLRSVILPSGIKILLSDTVGFISDLPVQLVEAFHATLEEVVDADLLLHVLDANARDLNDQRKTVLHVLHQIGVSEEKMQNMIEVLNKIDLLESRTDSIGHSDQVDDKCEVVFPCHSDSSLEQSIFEHEDDGLPYEVDDAPVTEEALLTEAECENNTNKDRYEQDVIGTQLSRERLGFVVTDETEDGFNYEEGGVQSPSGYECPTSNDYFDWGSGSSLENRKDSKTPTSSTCDLKDVPCVKTSAVSGVGLQELLYAIDEKLANMKSIEKRAAFSYFDRKWRPSHNKDSNKEAVS